VDQVTEILPVHHHHQHQPKRQLRKPTQGWGGADWSQLTGVSFGAYGPPGETFYTGATAAPSTSKIGLPEATLQWWSTNCCFVTNTNLRNVTWGKGGGCRGEQGWAVLLKQQTASSPLTLGGEQQWRRHVLTTLLTQIPDQTWEDENPRAHPACSSFLLFLSSLSPTSSMPLTFIWRICWREKKYRIHWKGTPLETGKCHLISWCREKHAKKGVRKREEVHPLRWVYPFISTHSYMCMCAHTHTCTHVHTHVRAHTHIHTHTHTHTRKNFQDHSCQGWPQDCSQRHSFPSSPLTACLWSHL
jgi:hypothetical protein